MTMKLETTEQSAQIESTAEAAAPVAQATAPTATPAPQNAPPSPVVPKKKKTWIKKLVTLLVIVAVLAGGYWAYNRFFGGGAGANAGEATYTTQEVTRQTIIQSISSSGTLTPANSYNVMTLVEGEVLFADFEEGDVVEKDAVLFEIDSSDTANNIEKAEISWAQSQRSYDNVIERQYLYSSYSGEVYDIDVEVGDEISTGQVIATLRDSSSLTLSVNFPSDDAASFYVGQAASLTMLGTFETIDGTVEEISYYNEVLDGNRIVKEVTISVPNAGGLSDIQEATATINGVASSDSAYLAYRDTDTIVAENSGEITNLYISQGSYVSKNSLVLILGGDDMDEAIQTASESLRTAELTMESTQDSLDNYTITSPISGTVIDKSYKLGDTVESGDRLCIIYDLEYLEVVMSIDELDISTIAVGQTVTITCDSVANAVYTGEVTKVSVSGTTYGGITTYPVTVRIDETDGLLPSLNVNTEIVITQATNVVAVPSAVIERGNIVLITEDSPSAVNALETEAPEGYVYVAVEIGISDDDYTEITSGLQEGDVTATMDVVISSDMSMMMPGMDSGMSSGMSSGMDSGMSSGMNSGMSSGMSGGGR